MTKTVMPRPKDGRPRKPKKANPILRAASLWLDAHPPGEPTTKEELLRLAPKGWLIYEPMVLLPSGSFASPAWMAHLSGYGKDDVALLWEAILLHISRDAAGGSPLTHLAANEGIPLLLGRKDSDESKAPDAAAERQDSTRPGRDDDDRRGELNTLRSPTRLRLLHGDFGPGDLDDGTLVGAVEPTDADFSAELWVRTRQNGILQTWAPRRSMFSRGNVTEKARLLHFHEEDDDVDTVGGRAMRVRNRRLDKASLCSTTAVDLYAGIGYFALSFAAAGIGTVLCWELNPWSVEALRRAVVLREEEQRPEHGKLKNAKRGRWYVRIVKGPELDKPDILTRVLGEPCGGDEDGSVTKIIVFQEDNCHAAERIARARERARARASATTSVPCVQSLGHILHVNCGLLPTSEAIWASAWRMVAGNAVSNGSWLHLHVNVAERDIEDMRQTIQRRLDAWSDEMAALGDRTVKGDVEHVERVKTFAPGVWHCVFDVYCRPV